MIARTASTLAPLLLVVATAAHSVDITTCFQTVPTGEVGVLQADLDCGDGSGGPNVTVERGARLLLNGHTISGGVYGIATGEAPGAVKIEGPGEIAGVANGGDQGCGIVTFTKAIVRDVVVRNSRCGIFRPNNYPIRIKDLTLQDNELDGILSNAEEPGNGRIIADRLIADGNGGIAIRVPGKLVLRDSTITGNGVGGIRHTGARHAVIRDTTLTGNGFAGDVAALVAPRFLNSTCDASQDIDDGGTLGICTGD